MKIEHCLSMILTGTLTFSGNLFPYTEKMFTENTTQESMEQEVSIERETDLEQEQNVLWTPAVYHEIATDFGIYHVEERNLIFELSAEEKNLIATDLMCEYMNGRYYLIYDDKVLYYSTETDGMHKIMAYDERTGMASEVYAEPYKDTIVGDRKMPNYLYLLGKYDDCLVYMDESYEQDLQAESGFIVIFDLENKEEIRIEDSYYMEGAYIQAACGKLVTSTSDGGYSDLQVIDMKTGEIKTISEKCRPVCGDYIKGTEVYYMEKRKDADQTYYLVCYDLKKEEECQRIELIGEWYGWKGCFWGTDLQGDTYVVTYDGIQYPYDGDCMSLNRLAGYYADYTSDGVIRRLNEETGEWEVWIDLESEGINISKNNSSLSLEENAGNLRIEYRDENDQDQVRILEGF